MANEFTVPPMSKTEETERSISSSACLVASQGLIRLPLTTSPNNLA